MRIDLDRILWRTRGHTWDYSFVLRPIDPHIDTWYDFHADAFSGRTPSRDPFSVGGVLHTMGNEELRFVATIFQDATLKDAAGRPVAHYIVWFPNIESVSSDFELPADWGSRIVQAFGDEWETAFSGDGASDDDILATARLQVKHVQIPDTGGVSIRFDYQIEKKKRRDFPPTRTTNRALLVIPTVGILILTIFLWYTIHR